MDVRCEKCGAEYEFDDARVTEAGVPVKCTRCGFVFKVRRAREPRPHTPATQSVDLLPPASAEKTREWKIRQARGTTYTCRELTTLQKWIIERKVSREDEISLTGDNWKRLGDIPELAGFFQVVEKAMQVEAMEANLAAQQAALAQTVPENFPPQRPAATTSGARKMTQPRPFPKDDDEPQWTQAGPPPPQPQPAPVRHGLGDSSADLVAIQRTSTGTYVALGVGLAVLVGFGGFLLAKGGPNANTPERPSSSGTIAQPNPAEQGTTGAAAVAVAPVVDAGPPPELDAGPPPVVDAGPPPVVDAGPPDAGPPPVVDAGRPMVAVVAPQQNGAGGNTGGDPTVKKPDGEKSAPPDVDVNTLLERAFKARESDHAQRALDLYDQATRLKPTEADIWSGRGMALIDLSRNSEAKDSFEKALRLAPNLSEAHMGLAEVLKAEGNKAEAIKHYQKALDTGTSEAAVAQRAIDELKSGN